jgi:hypothetical protein
LTLKRPSRGEMTKSFLSWATLQRPARNSCLTRASISMVCRGVPVTSSPTCWIRQSNHSSVAVQELMHTVGVLDPQHPGTKVAVRQIGMTIHAMQPHRTFAPDSDVLGRAALLSGMLCRLQGYQRDARLRALQDCVLFLQAMKLGFTVLTANVSYFDYLLQLIPSGRALFYRSDN